MGIWLRVGEAVIENNYDKYKERRLDCVVEKRYKPIYDIKAPYKFPINQLEFSYSGFSEFLRRSGLEVLFIEEELTADHPGINLIIQDDLDKIRLVKSLFKIKDEDDIYTFQTIEFLEKQFEYALKNCKVPAIGNG